MDGGAFGGADGIAFYAIALDGLVSDANEERGIP